MRQRRPTVRPRFACEALESRRLLAAGDLDRSFSDDGLADVNLGSGLTFDAADVAVQADGKTVIVGSTSGGFYSDRSGDRIVVARLLIDGRPDPSFGPDGTGVVTTKIDDDAHGYGVALQSDGKIVVVGTALETSGVNNYQHAVVRYEPWGALDPTFDGDGVMHYKLGDDVIDNGAFDVAIQGDGKIVVVGEYTIFETPPQLGDDELSILRFNPDGSRDITFGFIGLQQSDFGAPNAPVVTFDYNGTAATNPYYGSIVIAGTDGYDLGQGSDAKAVVLRLEGEHGQFVDEFDGDGQASFSFPGRNVTRALGVIAQPGGKIVLAGYTAGLLGDNDFLLVRYNPDGTVDRSFGGLGTGYVLTDFNGRNDRASSIIRSYNGDRLIVAGSSNGSFALARYTNDGVVDTAFQSGGKVTTPYGSGPFPQLAAGPGRRFTAAGGPHFHAARYLDEGANLVAIGSFDVNGGSEAGPEDANFLVTRTERLPTPLRVFLNVSGTAQAPIFIGARDYNANGFSLSAFVGGSFVDIPANETFVSLSITPVDDALVEGDETAIFSIAPDPSYDVGTPAGVTLEIHDGDATTVYAVADAHVRDGDAAGINFGAADVMETRLGGPGQNAEAYVKFDVSGIRPDTSGVRLRVFGRLAGGSEPVETSVFGVSASGWSEDAITWDNRPAPSTAALGSFGVGGGLEGAYSVDVTDFVRREKAAGRDTVTLLLRNAAASAAQTLWASRGSEYSDPRLIVNSFDVLPGPVPRVSQVFAASTAWAPDFRQALEDHGLGDSVYGYAVPDGAGQLRPLPWGKIDRVSVRFTRNVNVAAENLAVRGVRVGSYAVTGFAYDVVERVATWTLSPPIAARGGEKLLLDLDGDSPDGVNAGIGAVRRFLDGEWVNGSDTYPSGDGNAGGDLRFQVNVLPGDVDGSGQVAAGDVLAFRNRLLRRAADPFSGASGAYSPLYDLDGDGVVGSRDQASVRAALLTRLPAATPAAVAVAGRRSALVYVAPRRALFTSG
jgi:uncharacterized delta-60 repeat protein